METYQSLYKSCSQNREQRQEERRRELLLLQREQRSQMFDVQRITLTSPTKAVRNAGKSNNWKKFATFQDIYGIEMRLQLSEWLREIPANFDEWFLMPCPKGQRCLVVARGGKTVMYNKTGRYVCTFRSGFPGGGGNRGNRGNTRSDTISHTNSFIGRQDGSSNTKRYDCTILDCIYVAELDSFYVLDILYYGVQSLMDCDAEFRYFWLRSKFDECDGAYTLSDPVSNYKAFYLIKKYEMCNGDELNYVLQMHPLWPENRPSVAGFLFYHKESTYVCGLTPLVCWLFPFMVQEILQLPVNSAYQVPPNYTNAANYIRYFQSKLMKRKRYRNRRSHRLSSGAERTDDESKLSMEEEQSLVAIAPTNIEVEMFDEESTQSTILSTNDINQKNLNIAQLSPEYIIECDKEDEQTIKELQLINNQYYDEMQSQMLCSNNYNIHEISSNNENTFVPNQIDDKYIH